MLKPHDILGELEKTIEDKVERSKVLDGVSGSILTSTKVLLFFSDVIISYFGLIISENVSDKLVRLV